MATLAEKVAAFQRERQGKELPVSNWNPADVKGLEDTLVPQGFTVVPITEKMLAKDYKQSTTLLVMERYITVMRKRIQQKVTLYESGVITGTNVDLATVIPA
jgi:hypothetical protein